MEKSQDNPELVADLMRAVCQYFIPLNAGTDFFSSNFWMQITDRTFTNVFFSFSELSDDKFFKKFNGMFFKYFKLYVDNKEKLEMKCLVTVADYAREKSFPKGKWTDLWVGTYLSSPN